jgi:uncharacterized protein (TIGR00725 family)
MYIEDINSNMKKIAVIGGSTIQESSDIYDMAYEIGKNIASEGAALICGGLSGIMEAACRGAKEAGGLTIGILPSTDEETANNWVDIRIPTGLGYARNALVVLSSHAVIAIDGAEGTLSEIGYAITFNKPLIGLNTWQIKPYKKIPAPLIQYADTPEKAVEMAMSSISGDD